MRRSRAAAAVLAAALTALGLGAGGAAAASPLAGTWVAKTPGISWRLTFSANDSYVARASAVVRGRRQTFVAGRGRLAVADGRVTFRDRPGTGCRGRQAVGVYTYTLRGRTLRLRPVREPCLMRRTVLTTTLRRR